MSDSNGIFFKDPLSPILALVFTIVGAFLTYRVGLVKDIPFNKKGNKHFVNNDIVLGNFRRENEASVIYSISF